MPDVRGRATPPVPDAADALMRTVRSTVADLRQQDIERLAITPDSTLDTDLGLDSLARMELFMRVERDLGAELPDSLFATAETVGDILRALRGPTPSTRTPSSEAAEPAAPARSSVPPLRARTLGDMLAWHVQQHPDLVQLIVRGNDADERITFERLWRQARAIAGGLQHQGIRLGDTIALMLPTDPAYFYAFFGVLLAGGIPVPLYPPTRVGQIEEHVRRHAAILENSGAAVLIADPGMRRLAGVLRMQAPGLRRITTAQQLIAAQATPVDVALDPDSIALLQYTSGSTGQPKGVTLSHANLLANIAALGAAGRIESSDVFVSWLPLYHDMGLIGAWLTMVYFGLPLVVMPPLSFLTRPARWLQAIHRYGGTLSAAPNFAYELCLKRITDEELAGVNLASWRLAMNGAEAVMPETITRFQQRFAPWGFRPTAMTPVYGLAESSLGVTFPPLERGPLIDAIDREQFVSTGAAVPASADAANALRFVSCGVPLRGHQVRVVDDDGRELSERLEGRLELQGPSATRGYFRNPQATERLLHGDWLDSGDRAYIAAGEVYLTGRIKDIIVRAGRHIYPDELETALGAVAGIRKGCVAVLGITDGTSGTERVVVLAETHAKEASPREALRKQIVRCVTMLIGEPPDDVVLVAPRTVLKTTSGKIRRAANRELYVSQRHHSTQPRPAWQQLLRLSVSSTAPAARRQVHRLLELAYAAYFWAVLAFIAVLTCAALLVPLDTGRRWAIGHHAARAFISFARIPFTVVGSENLRAGARIVVANHASYLDGLMLLASLPHACRFVVKRELERMPLAGTILRRLNAVFVERFDTRASVADAGQLLGIAQRGDSLVFFPEGTFTRAPGLMPFHLGAFVTAVKGNLAVLPIAVRGSRSLLRDEQWLPRRVAIVVAVARPIPTPAGHDVFAASVQLRDLARRAIRERCDEPDLLDAERPHP